MQDNKPIIVLSCTLSSQVFVNLTTNSLNMKQQQKKLKNKKTKKQIHKKKK